LCCFFFQAEDGIRDLIVTGVQTCALPILTEVVLVGIVGGIVGIGFGVALSNGVLQTLAATVSNLYYQSLVAPRLTWVSSDVLVQDRKRRRVGKECRSRWSA